MYKVTVINPEASENARKNFTAIMIKLYNEGKIKIPDENKKKK